MRIYGLVLLFSFSCPAIATHEPALIPRPTHLTLLPGHCDLSCPWSVTSDAAVGRDLLDLLRTEIAPLHPGGAPSCAKPVPITLVLIVPDTLLHPEWYTLNVGEAGIQLLATTEAGLFRGSRSLVQLLEQGRATASLPCLSIVDEPRFNWRGMHLDVCRHFFPVDFVKKYIDLLARYKMNSFHWHLTEDQGWRIEILQYPKLTEVGAWRNGSQIGPYARHEYDTLRYGGFYTQDEVREVVAYATARHITVVPEIEMPGHALAALAAYPELSCSGGPFEVAKGWGVFEDVFCTTDSTLHFLENVLTEVMDLFPGPYIHIGGDECPKEQWKTCPKCQDRIATEGLADEHELQSWFIRRIEQHVNSNGRKIIGWDEILEGGLAPNAAVMSWRGTEGGIAAAKAGHDVVMSPGSHCYFDHYQGDPANEPLAFGGYTTVQKVYSYEPIPAELSEEEARHILGAQGNVWTEYILNAEHVEYMAVPRMPALAEVLWTPQAKRNEADFLVRLSSEFGRLDSMGVNASRSLYGARFKLTPTRKSGEIYVAALCDIPHTRVSLGWDKKPASTGMMNGIILTGSNRITATVKDMLGSPLGPTNALELRFNKATGRKITVTEPPDPRYEEGGAFTLVDGITAGDKRVNTQWLGWRKGVTITVDLGSVQDITSVGIGALNEPHSWIHLPERMGIYISVDGITYTALGNAQKRQLFAGRNAYVLKKPVRGQHVRISVKHIGNIPEGQAGAGNPAWLFLDEIEVR